MCDVLILDDDDLVLMTLAALLRDAGFSVEEASNSSEAIAKSQQESAPRLLVTDINLGENRTGIDVAKEIRVLAPELPVIFITGRPDFLVGYCLDRRQRMLMKPFGVASLVALIHELRTLR